MKLFKWVSNNILFILSLFLLAFIPLYPKIPAIDIQHTWVYIRAEDFVVALTMLIWVVFLFKKKITLKTPLTLSIMLFWIVGAISTLHGLFIIFPTMDNIYPNVALLSYLRRIEYLSVFFIGFSAIRDKKVIPYVVGVLVITFLLVFGYGIGQKFLGFPAFLTMNEEFAKGIPIKISSLSRVSSTFGGHYDLAAYLVLMIPLLSSMIFGFKNWFVKLFLAGTVMSGFVLLFMTVSRSSFIVLLLSLILMLFFQKKKLALMAIIGMFLMGFIFLTFSTTLSQRFGNTVKKIDVLVDAQSGEPIGHFKEIQSSDFGNETILVEAAQSPRDIFTAIALSDEPQATISGVTLTTAQLPPSVPLVTEPNVPTGEDLPQGTGYVNLPLTPITREVRRFFYQKSDKKTSSTYKIVGIDGNFLVKRVAAYDLSFTTRFQGEWPNTIKLFTNNIILGSGYSSTGLAVDNNYLRILGEIGLLGFIAYFSIFLLAGIYAKKILPEVSSPVVRSFVFGVITGTFGLVLNAALIDVFEASKIAFVLWLLIGITLGVLHLYQEKNIDMFKEFKKAITSSYAIVIYLFILVATTFSTISNYFFIGDDFTWFRWVADCKGCSALNFFLNSNGFFYRPGTKLYFLLMYSGFWLNQSVYHFVSIFLHFTVAVLIFFILKRILKSFLFAAIASFLFVISSGFSETVLWISATGHLFNAIFILSSLLSFMLFKEKKKNIYLVFSVVSVALSLLFHELGMVAPLIIVLYGFVFEEKVKLKELSKKIYYSVFFLPILPYLVFRYLSQSHWLNGDYSYNLLKLPYNFVGNTIGYLMLSLFGMQSFTFYEKLRNFSKGHAIFVLIFIVAIVVIIPILYKAIIRKMSKEDQKIIFFGIMFFIIALLPFIGLGNIAFRYSYLASVGYVLLFAFFLRKIFNFMTTVNDRNIAITTILIIISVFSLVNIIQLQKVEGNWLDAGKKVNRFVISLNASFRSSWAKDHMNFYFTNVPIKNGDAWVFPVGLKDAVWMVFRNENIEVHQINSTAEALNTIKNPLTDMVFEFQEDGSLIRRVRPQDSALLGITP